MVTMRTTTQLAVITAVGFRVDTKKKLKLLNSQIYIFELAMGYSFQTWGLTHPDRND